MVVSPIGTAIHPLRKEPQLDFPYMGYKFSPEEKEALLTTGNLGKTIEVTPKNAEPFSAYVSIDPQTNEIIALRADRVNIPKEIKGVTLSDAQYKELVEGKAVVLFSKDELPNRHCRYRPCEKQGELRCRWLCLQ